MIRTIIAVIMAGAVTQLTIAAEDLGLSMRVATDKTDYVSFEPVVISYMLRNTGNVPLEVPMDTRLGRGYYGLEIAGEDMSYEPYSTGVEVIGDRDMRVLAPGEANGASVAIVTSSLGKAYAESARRDALGPFPFSRPGKYSIRALCRLRRLGDGREDVQSNVLTISVTAPRPEEDIMRYFRSAEDYGAAVGGDYHSKDLKGDVPRWQSFVQQNPKSIAAPFVAYHLAWIYLNGSGIGRADALRAIDLAQFAADEAPREFKDNCLLVMAKAQIEAAQFSGAEATVEKLLRAFPLSDGAIEAKRIQRGLKKGYRTSGEIYSN